jgi:hypothetical protein
MAVVRGATDAQFSYRFSLPNLTTYQHDYVRIPLALAHPPYVGLQGLWHGTQALDVHARAVAPLTLRADGRVYGRAR